jgi:four helix bundle protein
MQLETSNKQQETGYRRLLVWKKADDLAFQIYSITGNFPKGEMFGLVSQMRRAAISVPANIVEGYARSSPKEKIRFYNIARGSLTELEYYLDFSLRLGYFTEEQHAASIRLREEVGRLLNGFARATAFRQQETSDKGQEMCATRQAV